ncbi:MAG TPA: DNA gyrase inhibitor YacG [Rubrivivax sp.]|jgi:endogenous inhibitor of DNA gyrase (YacG/DUF329 family)|nr:DNA gyrase inhibitor YacG [Rubrivivax sp.]
MTSGATVEVSCPNCRQRCLFGPANPWRPFCSDRCRGMDLGAWASEDYRVPAQDAGLSDDAADLRADPSGSR